MLRFFTICFSLFALVLPAKAAFYPLEIRPADNSQVPSLSTITVTWPGEWLEDVASGVCGKVENENGTEVATLTCEEDYSYEKPTCILTLSETITSPGQYTVYVNADTAFNEDEEGNDPFTIHYEIVEGSEAVIHLLSANPEDNSILTSLSTIETYWSEKISVLNSDAEIEVLDDNAEKVCGVTVSKGVFSTDPITLTLDETIKIPGKYTVIIPAGALETEDGMKSESCTLSYTISNSAETPLLNPVEINPADNSIIGHLYQFTIAWDSEFDFAFDAEDVGKVTDEFDITVATINCSADWMDENSIVFTLSQPISEEGTYTVSIEAGKIIASNGAKNNEVNLTYIIDPSMVEVNLHYWIFPSDSKIEGEEFPNIEIEFDEKVEMTLSEFTFESDQHETVTVNATLSYETVTLDCSQIRAPGVWTLTIPEGAFKSIETGSTNPENTHQWEFIQTLTEIDHIVDLGHKVSLSSDNLEIEGYDEVRIFDLGGEMQARYSGNVKTTLCPGVYFIQCIEKNRLTTYKVFIE